jgi:phage repressor protein C with HTH and peptisase S24 domain
VPVKAISGYLNGYQDPEFIKELPSFSLVGFTNGTYRAFEVSGDSMHPVIRDKSIVVGQYLENFFETKKDRYYVIKTKTELVVKSIINELKKTGDIILVSKNPYFEPYILPAHDIEEIWEIKVIISTPFNNNENEISSRIDELEKQLNSLRKKLK